MARTKASDANKKNVRSNTKRANTVTKGEVSFANCERNSIGGKRGGNKTKRRRVCTRNCENEKTNTPVENENKSIQFANVRRSERQKSNCSVQKDCKHSKRQVSISAENSAGIKNFSKNAETSFSSGKRVLRVSNLKNIDLDSLDTSEEHLDFEPPELHKHGFVFGKSKQSKEELRARGIAFCSGRWTKEEDAILRQNWKDFLKKHKLKNPMILLGINQGNKKELKNYIGAKKLYVQLGKDLNDRTLYSIYLRARNILGPQRSGTLTDDEFLAVKDFVSAHGNKWTAISSIVGQPASYCRESFRLHKENLHVGSWTKKEDAALVKSLKKKVKNFKLEVHHLPWEEIAASIPARNFRQCRTHWLQKLRKEKMGIKNWSRYYDAYLIYWLYKNLEENAHEIDWCAVYQQCQVFVASPVTLQFKWSLLKRKVPSFKDKNPNDIVKYLYRRHLPTLLKKINITMKKLKSIVEEEDSFTG